MNREGCHAGALAKGVAGGWHNGCSAFAVTLQILVDDLTGPEIAGFLEDHVRDMRSISPPESKHALDLEGLRQPDVTFWAAWMERRLVGCCALKELDRTHAEVKSMRVARNHRRCGIGAALVSHVIGAARARGYRRLSLETGSMPFFAPARRLYERHGFQNCLPFGSYQPDPNSMFFTMLL